MLRVPGRVSDRIAAAVEITGGLGAVVGHSAGRRVPARRARIDQDEPADRLREQRRERDGHRAAIGVPDDEVGPGLRGGPQEGMEVACLGGEGLRLRRLIAVTGAEP